MEEWKDIKGYEGLYKVSSYGRVVSLNYHRLGIPKLLTQHKNHRGYLYVDLWKGNKGKKYLVHRLVAQAFLSNLNNLTEVNHKDENKENNRIENLEWCSPYYNYNYGTGKIRSITKRRKAVIGISKDSGLILEFSSVTEAMKYTNAKKVSECCLGKRVSSGGYYWMYKEVGRYNESSRI